MVTQLNFKNSVYTTNEEIMTSAISMLTPGSVWERKTKKGSTYTTVIAVSNDGLPEETLVQFPQQVIFITEKYKILTQPIEVYLKTREYYGVDETAELLVKQLTTEPQPEPDEDDLDIDSIDLSGDDDSDDSDSQDNVAVALSTAERQANFIVEPVPAALPSLNVGAHANAELLRAAFIAYSEEPYFTGDTLHGLTFRLSEELTLKKISDSFLIADPNAVQNFEVTFGDYTRVVVAVDGYASCNMQLNANGELGTVFLTSSGDFRADEFTKDEASEPEPPAEITPQSATSVSVVNV
jgi:hypothetical protein